jgi:hypothetical protein
LIWGIDVDVLIVGRRRRREEGGGSRRHLPLARRRVVVVVVGGVDGEGGLGPSSLGQWYDTYKFLVKLNLLATLPCDHKRSHEIANHMSTTTVRVLENTSGTRSRTETLPEVFLQDVACPEVKRVLTLVSRESQDEVTNVGPSGCGSKRSGQLEGPGCCF